MGPSRPGCNRWDDVLSSPTRFLGLLRTQATKGSRSSEDCIARARADRLDSSESGNPFPSRRSEIGNSLGVCPPRCFLAAQAPETEYADASNTSRRSPAVVGSMCPDSSGRLPLGNRDDWPLAWDAGDGQYERAKSATPCSSPKSAVPGIETLGYGSQAAFSTGAAS